MGWPQEQSYSAQKHITCNLFTKEDGRSRLMAISTLKFLFYNTHALHSHKPWPLPLMPSSDLHQEARKTDIPSDGPLPVAASPQAQPSAPCCMLVAPSSTIND